VKCIPQIVQFDTWIAIILNCFDSWKFPLLNSVCEFSRTIFFVGNLVNFSIEKFLFCLLDSPFEFLPILESFGLFVHVYVSMTIIVPPSFRIFSDVNNLGVFMPYSIDVAGKHLNNSFESVNALDELGVDTLERMNKLVNKMRFLFTIID